MISTGINNLTSVDREFSLKRLNVRTLPIFRFDRRVRFVEAVSLAEAIASSALGFCLYDKTRERWQTSLGIGSGGTVYVTDAFEGVTYDNTGRFKIVATRGASLEHDFVEFTPLSRALTNADVYFGKLPSGYVSFGGYVVEEFDDVAGKMPTDADYVILDGVTPKAFWGVNLDDFHLGYVPSNRRAFLKQLALRTDPVAYAKADELGIVLTPALASKAAEIRSALKNGVDISVDWCVGYARPTTAVADFTPVPTFACRCTGAWPTRVGVKGDDFPVSDSSIGDVLFTAEHASSLFADITAFIRDVDNWFSHADFWISSDPEIRDAITAYKSRVKSLKLDALRCLQGQIESVVGEVNELLFLESGVKVSLDGQTITDIKDGLSGSLLEGLDIRNIEAIVPSPYIAPIDVNAKITESESGDAELSYNEDAMVSFSGLLAPGSGLDVRPDAEQYVEEKVRVAARTAFASVVSRAFGAIGQLTTKDLVKFNIRPVDEGYDYMDWWFKTKYHSNHRAGQFGGNWPSHEARVALADNACSSIALYPEDGSESETGVESRDRWSLIDLLDVSSRNVSLNRVSNTVNFDLVVTVDIGWFPYADLYVSDSEIKGIIDEILSYVAQGGNRLTYLGRGAYLERHFASRLGCEPRRYYGDGRSQHTNHYAPVNFIPGDTADVRYMQLRRSFKYAIVIPCSMQYDVSRLFRETDRWTFNQRVAAQMSAGLTNAVKVALAELILRLRDVTQVEDLELFVDVLGSIVKASECALYSAVDLDKTTKDELVSALDIDVEDFESLVGEIARMKLGEDSEAVTEFLEDPRYSDFLPKLNSLISKFKDLRVRATDIRQPWIAKRLPSGSGSALPDAVGTYLHLS